MRATAKKILWALLAVGLILRLVAIHARPEGILTRAPDEDEFCLIAQSVSHGDGFALRGEITAYRDLLMPVIAGGLMAVFGDSPFPMLYVNAALSIGAAFLLYQIGKRRFSERVAIAMAGMWAVYPAAILLCAMLFTESLFVFLWVLALFWYDRLEESKFDLRTAATLGIVCGLAMLTRAVGTMLPLSFVIYIGLIRFETPRVTRWRAAAVIIIACGVMALPWMIRNKIAVGRFALNTNGGINLLIGNNPNATGSYRFTEEEERLLPQNAGEAERDIAGSSYSWRFMREHPRETANLWGRKFAYLWATDMMQWIHYFGPQAGKSVGEQLHGLHPLLLATLALPYMLLVAFGISGYYLVRHFPTRGIFLLQAALMTAALLLTYGAPRYHLPLMPSLVIGAGALNTPNAWNSTPQWRRLFLLFTLGMFAGIWLFEIMTIAGV